MPAFDDQFIDPKRAMGAPKGSGLNWDQGQQQTATYDEKLKRIRLQTKAEQARSAIGANAAALPAELPESVNTGPDAGIKSLGRAAVAQRADQKKDQQEAWSEMPQYGAFGAQPRFRRPRRPGAFR